MKATTTMTTTMTTTTTTTATTTANPLRTAAIALALLLGAAAGGACGKGKDGPPAVDKAAYKALTATIHDGDAWAPTAANVDKVFGPAKTKADDAWTWASDDGDDCYELKVYKNGDKTGGHSGGHVNKLIADEYAKCAAHAKADPAK